MKTNYLVFGNGLLGTAFLTFSQQNTVKVLSKELCDVTNKDDIMAAVSYYKPDVVINCAGIVPKSKMPIHQMFKVNAFAPHYIADVCSGRCKFIHISTNCVFDGKRASYSEQDSPNAVDTYGMSKLLGEPQDALTIRTSFIGLPDPPGRGLLAWAGAQEQLVGYDKVLWNGVTTLELIKIIDELVKQGVTGLRHIYGFTYSKYDVLCYANGVLFGNRLQIIKESEDSDSPHIECKTLMSSYSDGYITIPIEQQLEALKHVP